MRHQSDSPKNWERRDEAHHEQWKYDLELLNEDHADQVRELNTAISELQETIQQLQQQLDNRPTRIVTENLDQKTVDDALDKREQAYRSRDQAFYILSEVRLLHHDVGDGTCKCRAKANRCPVAKIVDVYQILDKWEARQARRKDRGLDHMLPAGHGALIDPQWTSKLDDSELAD